MSTEWFDKTAPGAITAIHQEDPTCLLVGADQPDWVRLPPEHGRRQLKVHGYFMRECPKCKSGVNCRHLVLDDRYGVAECTAGCGFVWYRQRADVWTRLMEGITP